jgi:hypothetical protein
MTEGPLAGSQEAGMHAVSFLLRESSCAMLLSCLRCWPGTPGWSG